MLIALQLVILLFSVIIHEIAHGFVAYKLGDSTAKNCGRLSLNPIVHMDVLGSLLLPGLCVLSGSGFFIGWAKPVPVNGLNFTHPVKGLMWVALAGPVSNIVLALLSSVALVYYSGGLLFYVLLYGVQINLVLAVFNLIPLPPLDGSRILAYFLPESLRARLEKIEPYGFAVLFALVYFGILNAFFNVVLPPLFKLFLPVI